MDVDREKLRFFRTPGELRKWLERNGSKENYLWIGFYKLSSKKGGITYPEAVDEALCHGWIDGIRKNLDDVSYTTRFTPRRRGSIWSDVNVERVRKLGKAGRMAPAGIAAFKLRTPDRTRVYSYEREAAAFPPRLEKVFRANRAAWKYFSVQPPGYRRTVTWWVSSAKREETQDKRLARLIADCEAGRWIKQLARPG